MLRSTSPANVRLVSKTSLLAMVVVSTLALAACGGGGGGGSGSTPPPSPGAANTAPTVNAGADQAVTLPANAVDVSGSATDAENNTLTYAWSASPATGVAFTAASAAASRVTFTTAGTYTLTLTVSDGTATTTDTVQVVVNAAPTPANTPPTVQAGADTAVTLPNGLDLAGSATDAENNTLTYAWTADPATGVAFVNPAAAATRVTFTTAGTYTLTLSANDGTAAGSDALQVVVSAVATTYVYPGVDTGDENHGWTPATPAEMGMDETKLKAAADYALTGGGSGLIARRGRMVYKWGDIDSEVDLKSTTKSIGGIALALALDDLKVKLDDQAKVHLPTVGQDPADATPNSQTDLDAIKIFNLATHSAGFEKSGSSQGDILGTLKPVGQYWSYSDGGLNWLADLLTNVYQPDLSGVLRTRVWTPLDITSGDLQWRNLPASTPRPPILTPGGTAIPQRELASGIVANPNAMARIGLLYLSKGKWKDTQIVSEASVALAGKPYPPIATTIVANPTDFPSANANYGLLWWTNATKQLADVPADAYWAWGLGDSLIIVIPSLDIVIARVGTGPNPSAGPYWRSEPVPNDPQGRLVPIWDGNYDILRPFLTPIAQAVTTP